MKCRNRIMTAALAVATMAFAAWGQQRLLVVGGGTRPPDAVKKFVDWSGGAKARILIITWASGEPNESWLRGASSNLVLDSDAERAHKSSLMRKIGIGLLMSAAASLGSP